MNVFGMPPHELVLARVHPPPSDVRYYEVHPCDMTLCTQKWPHEVALKLRGTSPKPAGQSVPGCGAQPRKPNGPW